jgi:hypothetical protein
VDLCPTQLDQFGFDPFLLKLFQNVSKQNGCISALACASIQCNNLRATSVHPSLSPLPPGQPCSRAAMLPNPLLCSFGSVLRKCSVPHPFAFFLAKGWESSTFNGLCSFNA